MKKQIVYILFGIALICVIYLSISLFKSNRLGSDLYFELNNIPSGYKLLSFKEDEVSFLNTNNYEYLVTSRDGTIKDKLDLNEQLDEYIDQLSILVSVMKSDEVLTFHFVDNEIQQQEVNTNSVNEIDFIIEFDLNSGTVSHHERFEDSKILLFNNSVYSIKQSGNQIDIEPYSDSSDKSLIDNSFSYDLMEFNKCVPVYNGNFRCTRSGVKMNNYYYIRNNDILEINCESDDDCPLPIGEFDNDSVITINNNRLGVYDIRTGSLRDEVVVFNKDDEIIKKGDTLYIVRYPENSIQIVTVTYE